MKAARGAGRYPQLESPAGRFQGPAGRFKARAGHFKNSPAGRFKNSPAGRFKAALRARALKLRISAQPPDQRCGRRGT